MSVVGAIVGSIVVSSVMGGAVGGASAYTIVQASGALKKPEIGDITEALKGTSEALKGEKGETGDRGILGSNGIDGEKGEKGQKGAIGPQGIFGQKGDSGSSAAKGDPGAVGPIGPKGMKGEKGQKGNVGPIGPKGEIGSTGPQGIPGVSGNSIVYTRTLVDQELNTGATTTSNHMQINVPGGLLTHKGDTLFYETAGVILGSSVLESRIRIQYSAKDFFDSGTLSGTILSPLSGNWKLNGMITRRNIDTDTFPFYLGSASIDSSTNINFPTEVYFGTDQGTDTNSGGTFFVKLTASNAGDISVEYLKLWVMKNQ